MSLPYLYLDTNVIRDVQCNRRNDSANLFRQIKTLRIPCVSSIFTFMELVELVKTQSYAKKLLIEDSKDINEICREYRHCNLNKESLEKIKLEIENLELAEYIEFVNLSDENWIEARNYSLITNISAPDCIHITTAIIAGVDYFITTDTNLIKQAEHLEIRCKRPLEILTIINK